MFTVIIIMLCGVLVGRVAGMRCRPAVSRVVTALIWILLFMLGVEVGADRRMATMLGQTAHDVLLITDSDVPETAYHYGCRYALISREDYLNSNADALRPIAFLF